MAHDWPLLRDLTDQDRRSILQATTRRRFRKGDTVFHEGDLGDTFHLIDRGHVAVRVSTPAGDVATLTVLGAGDCFGEQALLSPEHRRTAAIVALEPTETLVLHHREFDALRAREPRVQAFLANVMALTVRRLSSQLLEALYIPVDKRLLRRLNDLVSLYGDGSGPVTIPITQEDLATMAGTTRPSANRLLKELADTDVVELTRGRITVIDPRSLDTRAR